MDKKAKKAKIPKNARAVRFQRARQHDKREKEREGEGLKKYSCDTASLCKDGSMRP